MSMSRLVLSAALLVALAACSSNSNTDTAATPASASTAMPASNPLTPMLNTRNRAKAVEQSLKAHDDAERKALQDAQQQ